MTIDETLGGKGAALAVLGEAGFDVPDWIAVRPGEMLDVERLRALGGELFAVRSSARGEDGGEHSFAGQLESFLRVPVDRVAGKVEGVRASARSESVRRYQLERGAEGELETTVIVQRMIDARVAGVAFSADPVSGRRSVSVVAAIEGTAEDLVSGEVDGEMWRYDGAWLEKGELLTDDEVLRVVELVRRCESFFSRPQDIEWAMDREGKLWLLQSRAITTLGGLPDPDDEVRIWDNSNIAESYGGVTTALTFSFARKIYEHVYREFCRMMRVPERRIGRAEEVFPQMLGMIQGRTYYNLLSWYRVLALLPGFSLNRGFMEQMMGVKEGLPDEITDRIASENREGRWSDGLALIGTLGGLVWSHLTLKRHIREFQVRLNEALAQPTVPFARMGGDELVRQYRLLESKLLKRWDAPLVNDFLAMIFNGVLRKLCAKWLKNEDVANTLIADCGGIISAEPPRRISEMGVMARKVEGLPELLMDGSLNWRAKVKAMDQVPDLKSAYDAYLEKFGDRCLEELKLESPTVGDDPESLLVSIGAMAMRGEVKSEAPEPEPENLPSGLKGMIFRWVLKTTRERVRDRENLRFERTRLFGRVRRLVRQLGAHLHADGLLGDPQDVFHLEIEELLGAWEGNRSNTEIRDLIVVRKSAFERCLNTPAPPDRVTTHGPLHRYRRFESVARPAVSDGPSMKGVGACPGVVRGRVRVVEDPRGARLEPGEILVARQTDPGWVVLFPCAAGLLVERGSVLSHSAIVSRELGLPCVVSLPGVMDWLETGELVEMDGAAGTVRKVADEE